MVDKTETSAARSLRLEQDEFGRLVLIDVQGQRHVGVEPVRAFPLSAPHEFISICDEHGREIASVADLKELPASVRSVLDEALAARQFVPVIERIVHVSGQSGPVLEWDVQTDRGLTRLVVEGEDDVRRLGPHRAMITDQQGVRYLIPDVRKLDGFSRRQLERFM